jgi:hypothetical protein
MIVKKKKTFGDSPQNYFMEGNTINWLQKWAISQIGGD